MRSAAGGVRRSVRDASSGLHASKGKANTINIIGAINNYVVNDPSASGRDAFACIFFAHFFVMVVRRSIQITIAKREITN